MYWHLCFCITGDEILSINSKPLHGMTHAEAIAEFKAIKTGDVILHVGRRVSRRKKENTTGTATAVAATVAGSSNVVRQAVEWAINRGSDGIAFNVILLTLSLRYWNYYSFIYIFYLYDNQFPLTLMIVKLSKLLLSANKFIQRSYYLTRIGRCLWSSHPILNQRSNLLH